MCFLSVDKNQCTILFLQRDRGRVDKFDGVSYYGNLKQIDKNGRHSVSNKHFD